MKERLKKAISILLTAAMLIVLLPAMSIPAGAEVIGSDYTATVVFKDSGNNPGSGYAVVLKQGDLSFDLTESSTTKGTYTASVPAGTYDIYAGGTDTEEDITVDSSGGSATVDCTPSLTATGNSGNYVELSWKTYSTTGHYMVYQKDNGEDASQYQTIPVSVNIKVLNVYPDAAGSDGLQGWMNTSTSGSDTVGSPTVDGVKYTMTVDKIDITTFNSTPATYLYKNSDGSYNYDVIYFGAWDSNNGRDLSASAANVVGTFIQYGGGCLFGHDTAYYGHSNFYGLASSYMNMLSSSGIGFYGSSSGSSTVLVLKNGLLTNFPYKLTGDLVVPACHSTDQFAMGDVWMNFEAVNLSSGWNVVHTEYAYQTGTNNFYLTTWNNCAMIQTGHSGGNSSADEQKILTNTLYYLAQITKEKSASDHMSQDFASPDAVSSGSVSSAASGTDGEIIRWTASDDNGSIYNYYLKEVSQDGSSSLLSPTTNATVTTGVSGYYVLVDTNATASASTVKSSGTKVTGTSYTKTGLTNGTTYYAHIVTVDGNDNLSGVTTASFAYVTPGLSAAAGTSPLAEANLNGNSLAVTLTGTTFADGTLSASNFTLNNKPAGLSVGSVSYTDATHCTVNLAYDGSVFGSVSNFSLTIAGSELNSGSSLTSGTLAITAKLHGTAKISGTAAYGQELTASVENCNSTGTLSYQWLRGGAEISGATGQRYTLTADDIGREISVQADSSVETDGPLVSSSVTVAKADCGTVTGIAPVLSSKTVRSITVIQVAGYEYAVVAHGAAVPSAGWQDSNVFTTLSPGRDYDVYQRVKETATVKASAPSDALGVTTDYWLSDTDNSAKAELDGQSQDAGTQETSTGSDGRITTTVTVDEDKMRSILESAETGDTVTLPITGDSDAVRGRLTGQTVKDMENKSATLAVQTDSAIYRLPAEQIDIASISRQFGEDISLSDIDVTVEISVPSAETAAVVESAAEDGGFTLMVPAVEFTISCEYNGRTIPVSSFNAYVERLIRIPDGVDPNKITTGVVVEPNGTTHHVPTQVTVIDGVYYARINSLTNSTYALVWHPIEFNDAEGHWAKDAINNMGSRMVLYGVGGNTFEPDRSMTRAEFAAAVVRALGLEPGTGSVSFSDVGENDWFLPYAQTAASYGIIKGYPDGAFGPNDTITREQAMAILSRAMTITGLDAELTSGDVGALLGAYADSAEVSAYAEDSVAVCLKTGIVNGRSSTAIAPRESVTRAEVAVMIQRLLQKSELI
ncbi:S-layer homology domain-containing protein [Papillibacter cinnamivorans]|uniref:S-layer homology domain-containing protein n=1 Tax=Papillibacter cinnamivorans DSM 12816 TaxID=1122930 RepID=A0A1W2C9G9_9FIRM|nr:S-layer homology domain-containing protein [Papillibacter cinnamivorans]SMC81810.1 S-layer homology domain-containing protein [Papillibacter cinnamivorans DSM 12816]